MRTQFRLQQPPQPGGSAGCRRAPRQPCPGANGGATGGVQIGCGRFSCCALPTVWRAHQMARAELEGRFATVQPWRSTSVRTEAGGEKLPQRFFAWGDQEATARERTTLNDEEAAANAQWQGAKMRTAGFTAEQLYRGSLAGASAHTSPVRPRNHAGPWTGASRCTVKKLCKKIIFRLWATNACMPHCGSVTCRGSRWSRLRRARRHPRALQLTGSPHSSRS